MKTFALSALVLLPISAVFAQTLPETDNKPYVLQTFAAPLSENIDIYLHNTQSALLNTDGNYYGAWTLQNGLLFPFADELDELNIPLSPQAREMSKDWYLLYRITPPSQTQNDKPVASEKHAPALHIDLFTKQGERVLPQSIQLNDMPLNQKPSHWLLQELAKHFPEFRAPVGQPDSAAVPALTDTELAEQAFFKSHSLNPDNHTIEWNNKYTHGLLHQVRPVHKPLGIINQHYQWILSPQTIAQQGYHNLAAWYPSDTDTYNDTDNPWYVFMRADNSNCYGLINAQGKQILPAQYTYYAKIDEAKGQIIAEHCQTKTFVLIDGKTGKHLFEPPLEYAHLRFMSFPDKQGDMLVQSDSENGVLSGSLNLNGSLTLPVRFSKLTEFDERNEAQAQFSHQNAQGIIRRDGKWAVPPANQAAQSRVTALPNSDWLEWSNSGYGTPTAYSLRQNPHHFVGDSPFKAQGIELVSGFDKHGYGLARKIDSDPVKMLQQTGFVNPQGQWLINPQYTFGGKHCERFDNLTDCARAVINAERTSSRAFTEAEPSAYMMHESAETAAQDLIHMQQNRQHGVIDRQGKVIVPFAYQKISIPQQQKFIIAETENSTHIYNLQGERLHTFSGSLTLY